jgi:predicted PurR-regulated permease PerM
MTDQTKAGDSRNEKETDGVQHDITGKLNTGKLNFSHYFLFFLIILVLIACYKIIQPYQHAIILATILAAVLHPVHRKIVTLVRGRENLAAFLSCLFLTLVVVLPLVLISFALIRQGVETMSAMQDWIAKGGHTQMLTHPVVAKTVEWTQKVLPDAQKIFPDLDPRKLKLDQMFLKLTSTAGKALLSQGGHVVGNLAAFVGNFFLMLFAFFFMTRDQEKMSKNLLHLIPLDAAQEDQITSKIKSVSQSAILGTFVTAIAQGVAGGLAFWIAGLPGLFWGMVMAFASLIPMVGTALIWVPAAAYLFISGSWGYGIFMVVWCVVIVGSIDNFLRPLFMQGSAGMSTMLIFFSILGGISYFGLIGLLYGPLIFGLALVLLYIYSMEFESFLDRQDRVQLSQD